MCVCVCVCVCEKDNVVLMFLFSSFFFKFILLFSRAPGKIAFSRQP